MVVTGIVQPLSEKTPTPTAATPVVLEKVREEISDAYVARNAPITPITAIAPIVVLFIAIALSLTEYDIMSLNKPYHLPEQQRYTQQNARSLCRLRENRRNQKKISSQAIDHEKAQEILERTHQIRENSRATKRAEARNADKESSSKAH
jgi:hypothetical protein